MTGVFKGAIGFGSHTLTEEQPGEYCGFLAKLDKDANVLWCKRLGEPYAEQGSGVAFDRRNGDILAVGFIRNKLPTELSGTMGSILLFARYDRSGVLRWSEMFGGRVFSESLSGRVLTDAFCLWDISKVPWISVSVP